MTTEVQLLLDDDQVQALLEYLGDLDRADVFEVLGTERAKHVQPAYNALSELLVHLMRSQG